MLSHFIEQIGSWGLHMIDLFGYKGLFLTMMLESAGIPIPSEIVLPFGGFLASTGRFSLMGVVAVTTAANLTGALLLYVLGYYGGSLVLQKSKYLIGHRQKVNKIEQWLKKKGEVVVFFSRLIPGTRTFSSLIIGAAKIKFKVFFWYTLAGSLIWNFVLAYVGYVAGERWPALQTHLRQFDYLILGLVIVILVFYIYRKYRFKHV